jgi:TolB-like protein/Tfp pilus assembly protein PilF
MRVEMVTHFVHELRRRRVLRTAALYVIGAWLALQIADVVFPGFGIPETAIRVLVWTAVAGFPVALVFGWFFDIGRSGIRRTLPAGAAGAEQAPSLTRSDYVILAAFSGVAGLLIYNAAEKVLETPAGQVLEVSNVPSAESLPQLEHSVAVLPFDNISNDPENESFCDGMSEEILNKLAGFRELNVIGRTSSFAFKGANYTVARISSLLGVRYVLQGSVRKYGAQLRIAAQLLDERGRQVWSQTFDRELVNVFDIQTEIADSVASTVATQVVPHLAATTPPDIKAYEYYVTGREWLHRRERDKAVAALEQAVHLDPDFAEAHAELAISLLYGAVSSADADRAMRSIARALQLKPDLPRARAAQGLAYLQVRPQDPVAAESVLRGVLDDELNMSDALLWLSSALAMQRREDDAFEVLKRAIRIDPLHPSIVGAFARQLLDRGQAGEAIALLERQLEQPVPGRTAQIALRELYQLTGRLVAMNRLAKRMTLEGAVSGYYGLAQNYALLGQSSMAVYWSDRIQRDFPDFPLVRFMPANLLAWLGDYGGSAQRFREAFDVLNLSFTEDDVSYSLWQGALLARSGDYAATIELLGPLVDPAVRIGDSAADGNLPLDGVHALAWSYIRTGTADAARPLLENVERQCIDLQHAGRLHESGMLHYCAENALLRDDVATALSRLELAVAAGWREYAIREHDPYWAALQGNVRYQQLMAEVKADVDRQRAQVEQLDAEENFVAKLDASLATGATASPQDTALSTQPD